MPVGHVFVGNPRGHIEHNDTALALNVVAISQTTKLFLAGGVPYIEADVTKVGMEVERVDLNTKSSCLNELVHELQSAERGNQACGKGAEFVAYWMKWITHRCISFQIHRSYGAVRYHEHVYFEVALRV